MPALKPPSLRPELHLTFKYLSLSSHFAFTFHSQSPRCPRTPRSLGIVWYRMEKYVDMRTLNTLNLARQPTHVKMCKRMGLAWSFLPVEAHFEASQFPINTVPTSCHGHLLTTFSPTLLLLTRYFRHLFIACFTTSYHTPDNPLINRLSSANHYIVVAPVPSWL